MRIIIAIIFGFFIFFAYDLLETEIVYGLNLGYFFSISLALIIPLIILGICIISIISYIIKSIKNNH